MPAATHLNRNRTERRGLWIAMSIVLALVLGTALIGRIEPMTPAIALASAALCAAGTLVVAMIMAPRSAYPRWAWWSAAGVTAFALLASVPLAPSAAVWNDEVRTTAWLLPWMLAIFGVSRESRACASGTKRGWVLVAAMALLSAVTVSASAIADGVKALLA